MVCCVYSLESPRWGDSNQNTRHTLILKEIGKIFLLCLLTWRCNQPSRARTTPVSKVPKVFEPLKFDCTLSCNERIVYVCQPSHFWMDIQGKTWQTADKNLMTFGLNGTLKIIHIKLAQWYDWGLIKSGITQSVNVSWYSARSQSIGEV